MRKKFHMFFQDGIDFFAKFLGLNNRLDPMVGSLTEDGKPLTWEWQTQADNVNLTDSGRYVRRDGYRPFIALPAVSSAFSTFDYQRLYVVSNGELLQCHDDGSTVLLADGLAGDVWWAEANDIVYVSGRRKLEILPDGTVREWGVPTPAGCRVTEGSGRLAAGRYQVCLGFRAARNQATNVPVLVRCAGGSTRLTVNQRDETTPFNFVALGEFRFDAGSAGFVELTNHGTDGRVAVDGVRWVWIGD